MSEKVEKHFLCDMISHRSNYILFKKRTGFMIGKERKKLSRRELVDIIYQLKKNEQEKQDAITVLDQTLTYQVDQIKVVLPNEISDVQIVAGEDLCTLLTCTPYGINSHRLLVRGTRNENAAPKLYVTSNAYKIDSLVATPVIATPILLIVLMVKYRDPGSKPLISKEEEEWLKEELGF